MAVTDRSTYPKPVPEIVTAMLAERAAFAAEELVSSTVGLHSERHPAVTVAEHSVQNFELVVAVSYETRLHDRPIPVASVSVRVRKCAADGIGVEVGDDVDGVDGDDGVDGVGGAEQV